MISMKARWRAAIIFASVLALAPPAFAQTDVTSAVKVACEPDTVTTCSAANQCETRPASARDKRDILVIDFASKRVSIRRGGELRPLGEVVEEQVSGDDRRFVVSESGRPGQGKRLSMTLAKSGKLMLRLGTNGEGAEATCSAES
jgi:hypothetical protein